MKLRMVGAVLWMLRWDLLAVLVVAGVMMWLSDKLPYAAVAQVVPLMGVVVSIFIGFRNSSAYNRWWEARTLWGTIVGNSRSIANALVAVDNCTEPMAVAMSRSTLNCEFMPPRRLRSRLRKYSSSWKPALSAFIR